MNIVGEFLIVEDKFRKTDSEILIPTRATRGSAGYDFYSPVNEIVKRNESKIIWTDIKIRLNSGYVLKIYPRSSMGKMRVRLANTTGIIDSDYFNNKSNDGNIGLLIENNGDQPFIISKGDRIAQGIISEFCIVYNDIVVSEDRIGGTGSSGK